MGLDMTLRAELSLSKYRDKDNTLMNAIQEAASPYGLSDYLPERVTFTLIQWRKANAIHQWFVTNTQGGVDKCQETFISIDQLKDLKRVCEQVLDAGLDSQDLADLLPTTSGCFFGSTEYDEYYLGQVEYTLDKLNTLLSDPRVEDLWITYQSSW